MSLVTIVLIIIGIIVLWGVIQGARGQKKWNKIIADQFSKAGVVNSPDAKDYVEKSITTLFHQETNIINEITDINKIPFENKEVYFCNVNIGGRGRLGLTFTDVFLFPLRLSTDQPLLLFFKSDCAEGEAYVKDIITKKYDLSDLYIPDGLTLLELSTQQELEAILFAYGEMETSLDKLVSATLLPKLLQAGKHGFFGIYYGSGTAALLTLKRHINHQIYDRDWDRQWQYVQQLMRL
jgi:hypothetical protein